MWISIFDEPIPTWGKNRQKFLLNLFFQPKYGHNHNSQTEVVTAVWDSINECFWEDKTNLRIDERDISEWWKDI